MHYIAQVYTIKHSVLSTHGWGVLDVAEEGSGH